MSTYLLKAVRRVLLKTSAGVCLIFIMLATAVSGLAATSVDLSVSSYNWTPDPVIRGGSAVFSVVATNNDASFAASNLTLAVQLPANIDFSTVATTTPSGCAFNLTANPQTLTCTKATLAALATWSLSFTGVGSSAGTQNTVATVSAADNSDSNSGNDSLTKPTTVIKGGDLTIQKSGPASATAGSTISFTIRVTNNGPDPGTTFRVTDNLPAAIDFTYQSASGTGWGCSHSGTTVTCDYSGAEVTSGNHAPDITLTGRVITSGGSITNGASVITTDGSTGDPVSGNNGPSQAVVSVTAGTDLRANKSMVSNLTGMTTFATGEAVTLTLSATNLGPQNATGVTITDSVTADFSIGILPGGCSSIGQAITCTVGALNNGVTSSGFVIPLTVVGAAGNSGTNSAGVTRTAPVGGLNTAATVGYTISAPFAHLTIAKSKAPNPVAAGANITNTITITNSNSSTSAATGTIRTTDVLDANEKFVSFSGSGWGCSGLLAGETGTITCDYSGANLARGASLPALTIITQTDTGYLGPISNTACTGQSAGSPHTPADNSSTGNCQSRTVTATPRYVDLSVAKSASTAHLLITDNTFNYTLTIANAGPDMAPTVRVNDVLNAWYSGLAGSASGSAEIGGAVGGESCSFGSTVSCTLLDIAGGTSRTITITLNRPMKDGTIANTATVSTPDAIDTVPGNNSGSVSLTIDPLANVGVTSIAAAPDPIKVGVQLTYTTSIKNNGPSTAAGVVLRHLIDPAKVTYSTGSASLTIGGSCSYISSFVGAPYAGQSGIECSGFSLSNGESRQLTFKVIPVYPYPGGVPNTYSSTAYITTTTPETDSPGYANNENSNSTGVIIDALDLAVTDNDPSYDPTAFGDAIIYQIKVQNNGPSQATAFTLTVTPVPPPQGGALDPYAMTYNATGSSLPVGATCSPVGSDIVCYLGAGPSSSYLALNSSQTFSLKFDTGPLTNIPSGSLTYKTIATVSSNETLAGDDSLPGNNSVTETTTVLPKTDLMVVSKAVSKATVDINEPFTYTVTVGNKGPSDAAGMKVTDILPAGIVLTGAVTVTPGASVSLTSNTCTTPGVGNNGTIDCTIGPIPTDASGVDGTKQITIGIPVRAAYQSSGTYSFAFNTNITNTATAAVLTGVSLDPDNSNNSRSVTVQVRKNSIGGTVYADNNKNDIIDAGEGINSVTLTLTGTDSYGNTYLSSGGTYPAITTTTAGSGNTGIFTLDKLPPGTWAIAESQPANYYDAFETAGTAGGTVPPATCDGTNNCGSAALLNTISGISLPADTATATTGYIFQEYQRASLTGYVYHDANNDGDKAAGETTGVNTQSITLSGTAYNNVNVCTIITCTINTNASGLYNFSTLPPSDGTGYTVTQNNQPAGYLPGKSQNGAGVGNVVPGSAGVSAPKSITGIVLTPSQSATNRNFGELRPATISGFVFIDADADAVRDAGETSGMTGLTVALTGTDDLGNPVGPTNATTGANGSYSFTNNRPGTYAVTETPPSGVVHIGAQAGSKGGDIAGSTRASGVGVVGAGNLSITNIPIVSNDTAANYNFGESGQGLSGYVYIDSNANGIMDAGEPGILGVQITLSGNTDIGTSVCVAINPNPCTISTNASGYFLYSGLPASDVSGYTLTEQLQTVSPLTNYSDGSDNIGTVGGTSRGSAAVKNRFSGITLAVAENGINYNFGELAARISGTVYYDADNDGAKGGGEAGLSGITVTITGTSVTSSAVNKSAVTDASGNFTLGDLLPANGSGYTLTVTQPANYADGKKSAGTSGGTANAAGTRTITAIALGAGANATGYFFGETLGSLSGTIYYDANNDGAKLGATEVGIGGVTITLSGTAASGVNVCTLATCTAVTNAGGSFSFAELPAANGSGYTLTVTQPANYADGKKTAGTSGGTANAAGTRTITAIALAAGANGTGYLFGETLGSLSGTVYYDANNDGAKLGAAETGISGVSIALTGIDLASGAAVSQTAVTDINGDYSFSDIPASGAGGYTLTVTQPTNYADGKKAIGTSGGTAGSPGVRTITGINFAAGTNATGYLFGETLGSLTGTVYYDSNDDGFKLGASETGIPGVTVTLSGNLATGTPVSVSSVTDGSGNYSFSNIGASSAGGYTLTVTQPVIYADGKKVVGTSGGTAGAPGIRTISDILFASGTNATGYLFGERLGRLSGTVYTDRNNDGVHDADEPGISGVTLTLSGTDAAGAAVNRSMVSATDGSFSFADVAASNGSGYTLTETQPVNYADGLETVGGLGGSAGAAGTSVISGIVFTAGASGNGYLFGDRLGGLIGIVYVDDNNNGVKDAGEAGIANVSIALTGTDASGAAVNRSVITASDGTYSFADVAASNGTGYTLSETQPVGYLDGIETAGTLGGSAGAAGSSVISGIVYPAASNATGYLFGERLGVLSGFVYYDANNNGAKEAGEEGIAGIAITLTGTDAASNPVNRTTTTGSDGGYTFSAMLSANSSGYTLTEIQPPGMLDGKETAGTLGGVVDNSSFTSLAAQNQISAIPFAAGNSGTNYLFGERLGSLAGIVYYDPNNNGLKDPGETGIAGATLTLTGTDATNVAINRTATTAADGSYTFVDLPASDASGYTVTENQPVIYSDGAVTVGTAGGSIGINKISAIHFAVGMTATGYLFGERLGSLSGTVYTDKNGDGVRDAGEPGISGITITLSGTDAAGSALSRTTLTVDDGSYSFKELPVANSSGYTLTETQPINYLDGRETAGTLGGTVDNASFTALAIQNRISAIPFAPGDSGSGYLFGERLGSLSGIVFYDANNNGAKEAGEDGLAGVGVSLTGTNIGGSALNLTTVTAADGSYSFVDIPASNASGYTLTETQPPAYTDGQAIPGSAGGAAGINAITAINFAAGINAAGYLFAERLGALTGSVYLDINNNNIIDTGETGIAGVTITLSGIDAAGIPVNRTSITAGDGKYGFSGLPNANGAGYRLVETQPATYLDGKVSRGLINGVECNACDTAAYNQIGSIPYNASGDFASFNFGELQSAGIAGQVYLDLNNNGTKDANEPGLSGVSITVGGTDDRSAAVNSSVNTDADGKYRIDGLRPSSTAGYTITETQPAGYGDLNGAAGVTVGSISTMNVGTAALNSVSAIILHAGESGIGYNFGDIAGGLTGSVYIDANDNGTRDGGESGIAGVMINLTGTDASGKAVSLSAMTAADGSFGFSILLGGTYTLTETHPLIFRDGRETAGTAGGTVDNGSFGFEAAQNRISGMTLAPGVSASGYLFGERPGVPASISGTVWYNSIALDHTQQPGEHGLAGWIIEAVQNGIVRGKAISADDGTFQILDLPAGSGYELRYKHPLNGALYGNPVSQDPNYHDSVIDLSAHTIANLTLRSGANIVKQDLPLDPSGVVYNSRTRNPLAGATVSINGPAGFNASTHLLGGIANQSQVTDASGFYQFMLLPTAPSGTYSLTLTAPTDYVPGISSLIPPTAGPFDPGPGPGSVAIQTQPTAPNLLQSTRYYVSFTLGSGSAGVVNNHLPLDPMLDGAITIQKTTPVVNVHKGDLVPYTVTAINTLSVQLSNIDLHDRMPSGFKYRDQSARFDNAQAAPNIGGRDLVWKNLSFAPGEKKTLKLILVVGTGVGEGEYTNQAWASNNTVDVVVSNIAAATVRTVPDHTFDCTDVIGKVFDDRNANGYQDDGEPGLPNIRIASARGLIVTTDSEGRFHVPCAAIPDPDRGSNFIMKLDERTLPAGYRITTENPRDVRATRGKMVKLNFGATLYRVVRIDMTDAAFEREKAALLPPWQKKVTQLDDALREHPSVLTIIYRRNQEPLKLAKQRTESLRDMMRDRWKKDKHRCRLIIETEIEEVR